MGVGGRVTIPRLRAMRDRKEPIVWLTAYDATFAALADESGVDVLLVGDSLGNVLLGHPTTVSVTIEDMVRATEAVARTARRAMVVADLPFGTVGGSFDLAFSAAVRLMRAGAQAVKLEGDHPETIRRLIEAGIPVCAHLGFTPQSIHTIGGHRADRDGVGLEKRLRSVTEAGAFATVLELVPASIARRISDAVPSALTIGIGAGPGCHGQVQVMHDVLGLGPGFRHARPFTDGRAIVATAFSEFVSATRSGQFPTDSNAPAEGASA